MSFEIPSLALRLGRRREFFFFSFKFLFFFFFYYAVNLRFVLDRKVDRR